MADIFHTFFGISGLSLLGHFKPREGNINSRFPCLDINPTYALPQEIVVKFGLQYQVLPSVD